MHEGLKRNTRAYFAETFYWVASYSLRHILNLQSKCGTSPNNSVLKY